MALTVITDDPHGLVSAIQDGIDDGVVRTWSYDADGDLTHAPEQWAGRAWMRPRVSAQGNLVFNIVVPRGVRMTKGLYAVYHGRLAEMLLAHFDLRFSAIRATALPTDQDAV